MNSIKGFLKSCLCCFKKQKITNDVLCDSPPKDKKTKNKKFLSCFTVQEDFDIIDSNEIPSKIINSLKISVDSSTQTEENDNSENDFIITDSYLEKN